MGNITGSFTQTVNLTAGEPQLITGPGTAFEVVQPGEGGTTTVIQALRESRGVFSDNTPAQAFTSAPGIRVANFDKLTLVSPVDSQIKLKVYTAKAVASVDIGPTTIATKTLWSTGIQGTAMATADDPVELSGPDVGTGSWPTMRGDGLRELKYTDRSNITADQDLITPAQQFAQIQSTVMGWWTGWLQMDSVFYMEVYAAPYNGPTTATPSVWNLVQRFAAAKIETQGTIPSTDGSQTFTTDAKNFIISFDGQDNKDYTIPYGSLRVYVTGFTDGENLYGILGAKSRK